MKTICLHIGMPKVATTFLQQEIFKRFHKVNNIDVLGYKDLRSLFIKISHKNLSEKEIKDIRKLLSKKAKKPINLISCEMLVGDLFTLNPKNVSTTLDELIKIFKGFHIKIIFGIREQLNFIASLYKAYLNKGGTKNIEGFIRLYNKNIEKYKYSYFLKEIFKRFKKEYIYVYIYEDLKCNGGKFLKNLLRFIGETKVQKYNNKRWNTGYGLFQAHIVRLLNPLFKQEFNPKGVIPVIKFKKTGVLVPRGILHNRITVKIFSKPYKVPLKTARKLKPAYVKDNEYIQKKYNLKLPNNYM